MEFELSMEQRCNFFKWKEKLEAESKKSGKYRFEFSNSGIGLVVKVKSDLAKKKLDLTDYKKW